MFNTNTHLGADAQARIARIERAHEKSREAFYIDRNKNIEEINKFSESIKALDPKYVTFEYPELTPENLLPSLFAEEFDEEQYAKEREALLGLYDKFAAIQLALIEEAEKLYGL